MAKRIYFESLKKWLIGSGITVGTLVGGLFLYLNMMGLIEITGHSGDSVCEGTIDDPCYAYVNLTAKEDIFIYPVGYDPWGRNTIMEFSPGVKDWKLQRSWGNGWRDIPLNETCTGKWCGAPNNLGVTYSYVLRESREYQFRIVAYKNSPFDTIKWAVNYDDREYLDPVWDNELKDKSTKEKLQDKDYQKYLRESNSVVEKNGKTKSYDSIEKRLKIEDKNNVLIDMKLESDYTEAVMVWSNMSLSAWFDLKDFKGIDLVDDVRFFDANNNYTEVFKEYVFKYKEKQNVSICDINGLNCKIIEDDVWVEFNDLSELKKNIKIGLFINIEEGDKIEWVIEKDGFEILEWALVMGTNCGFVSTAPTSDPSGSNPASSLDTRAFAVKDTASVGSTRITEIGWWCDTATEESNFEVGLYTHDSGNDEPLSLIAGASITNAKGTTAGWKSASVDIEITEGTIYWIAVQLDDTSTDTFTNYASGISRQSGKTGQSSLPSSWGGTNAYAGVYSLYAVYEEAPDTTKPTYSNNAHNSTLAGQSVKFSILYDDDTALHPAGQYIFSTNNTGTWVNESAINFTATPSWANVTKTLNSTSGISIGYRWFANDNAGNINNTEIFTLTTTSAPSDTCNPTSPLTSNHAFNCADNCTQTNSLNASGYNLSFYNSGFINIHANIISYDKIIGADNCQINILIGTGSLVK